MRRIARMTRLAPVVVDVPDDVLVLRVIGPLFFAAAEGLYEPIARSMEFVFPGQGMERVMDQFMVGDALLVAPVWKQGEVVRSVTLPEGQWRCVSLGETEGDVLNGGRNVVLGENEGLVVLKRV